MNDIKDLEKKVVEVYGKLKEVDEKHELLKLVKITGNIIFNTPKYNARYKGKRTEEALKSYLSELEQAVK
ncbi:hypothetical protein B6U80_01990 [Candidatus Pacearchaeota archaeon ex4484_26]|nr:MAG: hypothetical protein B6U80_01990 [Candidatus Pacearchaeota archaeon ex4484_26]